MQDGVCDALQQIFMIKSTFIGFEKEFKILKN